MRLVGHNLPLVYSLCAAAVVSKPEAARRTRSRFHCRYRLTGRAGRVRCFHGAILPELCLSIVAGHDVPFHLPDQDFCICCSKFMTMNSAGRTTETITITRITPCTHVFHRHAGPKANVNAKCVRRRGPEQRTHCPLVVQKILDHALERRPGGGIVRRKDKGLCRRFDRLFQHDHRSPHVDIAPILVVAVQRARAPDQNAPVRERADRVDRLAVERGVQIFLIAVGKMHYRFKNTNKTDICGCLENTVFPDRSACRRLLSPLMAAKCSVCRTVASSLVRKEGTSPSRPP